MLLRSFFAAGVAAALVVACGNDGATPGIVADDAGAGASGDDAGTTSSGGTDAGLTKDAASSSADAATADAGGCGEFAGDAVMTCSKDGNSLGKCPDGKTLTVQTCARGCLRNPDTKMDSTCLGTTDAWTCTGSYGTKKSTSGDYYLTAFGCWKDASGTIHTDPGDNCIPGCLAEAKAAGVCKSTDTGPDCEEALTWYTADSARFGCLARVRITNPANGKAVVAIVLDAGPACTSVEDQVMKEVLDASGRVDRELFGADQGYADKALVHVVEVDPSTPLGPVP